MRPPSKGAKQRRPVNDVLTPSPRFELYRYAAEKSDASLSQIAFAKLEDFGNSWKLRVLTKRKWMLSPCENSLMVAF